VTGKLKTFAKQIAAQLIGAMDCFPIGNVRSLANALDRLLCDSALLAEARRHAWTLGQTRWNWECEQGQILDTVSGWLATLQVEKLRD